MLLPLAACVCVCHMHAYGFVCVFAHAFVLACAFSFLEYTKYQVLTCILHRHLCSVCICVHGSFICMFLLAYLCAWAHLVWSWQLQFLYMA
jgi:hypothetical protein